jgi:hypothetical protein
MVEVQLHTEQVPMEVLVVQQTPVEVEVAIIVVEELLAVVV